MDAFKSFKHVEKKIEKAHKDGQISRERAKQVLDDARKNYKNNSYNREMDKQK